MSEVDAARAVAPAGGGAESEGTGPAWAEPGGAGFTGAEPAGAEPAGAEPEGAEPAGAEPAGAGLMAAEPAWAEPVGAEPAAGPAWAGAPGSEPVEAAEVTEEATAEATAEEPLGFTMPPVMSQMLFVDVVLVLPSTHPVIVLQEKDFPFRELRIPIGGPEGIAIGYASRRVPTPRPLTHELMARLLESFALTLDLVHITGTSAGMYTAEITLSGPTGQRVLDCRPSDAIALALRQAIPVPIMASPEVLERAAGAAAGAN